MVISPRSRLEQSPRAEAVRARIDAALRTPAGHAVLQLRDRDQRIAGGILASALAYRLFGALLPLALLAAVVAGWATENGSSATDDAAEAFGLSSAAVASVAESARVQSTQRIVLILLGLGALGLASRAMLRALRGISAIAWDLPLQRKPIPMREAVALIAAVLGMIVAATATLRAQVEDVTVAIGLVMLSMAAIAAIWVLVSRMLPHAPRAPWTAFVPGAAVLALGLELLHMATVFYFAGRLERAAATYGALGLAFTILVWLYVLSRLIVGSAMVNAALWERRSAASPGTGMQPSSTPR